MVAGLTIISYLVVSCKDPGYVTSYVLRGDEFEDDIELARKECSDKSKFNGIITNKKKKNHKVKRV